MRENIIRYLHSPFTVDVVEATLTDNSKVYDVAFSYGAETLTIETPGEQQAKDLAEALYDAVVKHSRRVQEAWIAESERRDEQPGSRCSADCGHCGRCG